MIITERNIFVCGNGQTLGKVNLNCLSSKKEGGWENLQKPKTWKWYLWLLHVAGPLQTLEDHSHETANSTGDKRHGPGEMKCLRWWMEAIISWCESYWECSINKYSSSIVTLLSTRKSIENIPTASHYLKISFCFNIFHVWLKQSKMRVKGKTYLTSGLPCHIACEINFLCIINCY